jgi:di/tricarboxylate transporter
MPTAGADALNGVTGLVGASAPWVLVAILGLFLLLAHNRIAPVRLFITLAAAFYLLGWIELERFLQSYVNPAVMTLMLLLLVGVVLEKTTWVRRLSAHMFHPSLRQTYARMGLWVGVSSAFLNNTAVVSGLLAAARNNPHHAASKVLMPLSYLAILGGTLTLVGTSTHLILNGLLVQADQAPLALLDFFYVGSALLLTGLVVVVALAPRLLPAQENSQKEQPAYFMEAKVLPDSPMVGKSVQSANLRHLQSAFLVEILRDQQVLAPVSPTEVIQAHDRLLFSGDMEVAVHLKALPGLTLPGLVKNLSSENLSEVVVAHTSVLVGQTLKSANFRNKFNAAVIAINRGQERLTGKLGDVVLQAGDKLLLAIGQDFFGRENLNKNFYFVTPRPMNHPLTAGQSWLAGAGFLGVLIASALNWISLFSGLLVLLGVFTVLGWASFAEIKRRLPMDLLLIIGSALVVAEVMRTSGAAQLIVETAMPFFMQYGTWSAFLGVYLLTLVLTETVTNNAAAALVFPVALATAQAMDANLVPFVLAVAYGASASFLTPYGYQTNLMVYAPGKYRFLDYVRMGLPVSLVYSLTVLVLTPWFFPFT